ncbi:hypothetical protein TPA0908_20620 [Micromonospora sp. AKA38]|nr:hypothetical protein TPA0908_20620 [Micromonospora sp. AKA38]
MRLYIASHNTKLAIREQHSRLYAIRLDMPVLSLGAPCLKPVPQSVIRLPNRSFANQGTALRAVRGGKPGRRQAAPAAYGAGAVSHRQPPGHRPTVGTSAQRGLVREALVKRGDRMLQAVVEALPVDPDRRTVEPLP